MNDYILKIKNISKTFPNVKAVQDVSLDLKKGEVLALCGENGAGKSTLMKILAAVYQADRGNGEILFEGKHVHFRHPLEAKKAGIILIFQELSLVKDLSVAENIFLGSLPKTKLGLIDWPKLMADTKNVLKQIDCHVDPSHDIRNLQIAQQQMIEIARAIALGAKILILDEPTSSLTDKEKSVLFDNIRKLKASGVAIIYITHKMDEVFEISDRISVLRDGHETGTLITKDSNIDDVIKLMIGRSMNEYYHRTQAQIKEEVLKVENLTINGIFNDIGFKLHKGEVLGLYGLVGAGRTEIVETIFGIRKHHGGKISIEEKPVTIKNSFDAISKGIGLVPEDRKEQGLVLGMSCKDNLYLANLTKFNKKLFVNERESEQNFIDYKSKLSIVTPNAEQKVRKLSGGNQQKVVIGKWLSTYPKVLIMDEPTRGIDIGAKAEIYKLIAYLSELGIAIIIISSEMPEIMGICTRIITIANGKITGEFIGDDICELNIIQSITMNPAI